MVKLAVVLYSSEDNIMARIFSIHCLCYFSLTLLAVLATTSATVLADDNAKKNHRAEKRQDDSFLFFGGWRPVKPGNPYYHGSMNGRYHDLISALPDSLDTSSSYYTHALPKTYTKDIYSYYPRPAIRPVPKKNTPVYMETYKPRRQPQKHHQRGGGGGGGVSHRAPQFIDIQKIDLKKLRNLHDVIVRAQELPLSQLNLGVQSTKPIDLVELSLQALHQNGGGRNGGYGARNRQGNNKGYSRIPHVSRSPPQQPVQFEYIPVSALHGNSIGKQGKEIATTPIRFPQSTPSIDDVIDIKNIQIVEVEVPHGLNFGDYKGQVSGGQQYGKRDSRQRHTQHRTPSRPAAHKVSFPSKSYFTHRAQKPKQIYTPAQQQPKYNYVQQQQEQPEIEAELIKLNEEQVQHLLKNLQVVDKGHQDILRYLPLSEIKKSKSEDLHLIVALPQEEHVESGQGASGYTSEGHQSQQQGGYGDQATQYVQGHQEVSYPSQNTASAGQNSGGYQINGYQDNLQGIDHNSAGYQLEDSRSNGYEQVQYQSAGDQNEYSPQDGYKESGQGGYEQAGEQEGYDDSAGQQGSAYKDEGQSYIEVIHEQTDENGYRREPVLALELKHGQTIEDAIKSLDPETLQKLGAHGKDGLEIEVVEVPVDDYASESKKSETIVDSKNSTVTKTKT